ncbi:MAG: hypothetical protein HY814_11005 [Candidatus Riflebacteria bacterium]|nr:hypothetical protein [Candidatus Riflebacteria bacterium]
MNPSIRSLAYVVVAAVLLTRVAPANPGASAADWKERFRQGLNLPFRAPDGTVTWPAATSPVPLKPLAAIPDAASPPRVAATPPAKKAPAVTGSSAGSSVSRRQPEQRRGGENPSLKSRRSRLRTGDRPPMVRRLRVPAERNVKSVIDATTDSMESSRPRDDEVAPERSTGRPVSTQAQERSWEYQAVTPPKQDVDRIYTSRTSDATRTFRRVTVIRRPWVAQPPGPGWSQQVPSGRYLPGQIDSRPSNAPVQYFCPVYVPQPMLMPQPTYVAPPPVQMRRSNRGVRTRNLILGIGAAALVSRLLRR